MSDVVAKDPKYTEPPVNLETENEHRAWNQGFAKGYHEGRDDLLFGLAKGFAWATEKLASVKAELDE